MSADDDAEQMECMEVWGGTAPITRQVRMQGLDAWVYSRPCGDAAAGGDVYYASSCATGRISRLLLADVSGHGSAVGDIGGVLRGLMRRFVNFIDQTQFVRAMNAAFVTASPDGVFATAVVSTFFAPTNRLTVCNAGHPQPLWYRAADGQWTLLRQVADGADGEDGVVPGNMPLGILELVDYQQTDVEMSAGDLVLFYTDALTESYDRDGAMLNEGGLLQVVQGLASVDAAGLVDALRAMLESMDDRNLRGDDVTVLLLRPTGGHPRTGLAARARGMGRFVWAVVAGSVTRPTRVPLPDFKLANVGGVFLPWLSRLWRPPPAPDLPANGRQPPESPRTESPW